VRARQTGSAGGIRGKKNQSVQDMERLKMQERFAKEGIRGKGKKKKPEKWVVGERKNGFLRGADPFALRGGNEKGTTGENPSSKGALSKVVAILRTAEETWC